MSDINNNELYKCSSKLEKKGYEYDKKGIYCPITNKIFLKITREETEYAFVLVEKEGSTSKYISPTYKNKKSITELSDSLKSKIKLFSKKKELDIDAESKLIDIAVDLMNEDDYAQINKSFDVYESGQDINTITATDSIEKDIEKRKNPKLNPNAKRKAEEIETKIKEQGLVNYLDKQLDCIHIGKHTNIYRKLLGAFKIMKGEGSYIFETIAKAGEGKSLEDEIVFGLMIPKQYIYKVNSITKSSFTRYADKSEYYFDRMILLFGDFGSQKSFGDMEELLNILKVLITEKEYVRDLSDKGEDGIYDNKKLKLKCNSIGGVYSSVINEFTQGDSQLESRTISCTPYNVKEEEVMDFMILLDYEDSKQSKAKKKAEKELKKFQKYLLDCLTKELQIINPYGEVFKRHALHSDVPKRELKQLLELFDAYCKLTYFNCYIIDGHMVASEEQLNEFMRDICRENALIPYESDFLKMIMAEGKKNELTIIDNDEEGNSLNTYYNNVLETTDIEVHSFADLTYPDEDRAIKKLLKLYKLGGTSSEHKENVFLRISDLRRCYSKYKAYKNIDNVQKLIHRLVKKGYLDSIEYQDGKQSIYYLTEQCKNIAIPFELTEEDKESAKEFLCNIGVVG